MKLNALMWTMVLLAAFLGCSAESRPVSTSQRLLLPQPMLLHQGEEFSLRLGRGRGGPSSAAAPDGSSSSMLVSRALLQLTQRLLQAGTEQQNQAVGEEEEEEEKGKRSEESPLSLDLTFHLLRGVLEMARAEKIAQQADSNRKMMDTFGK